MISVLPKVSFVTCTYNRPRYLREAIESLRRQTDPDWEHLIYDDASTDIRVAETLAWAKEGPRVRVWRGDRNVNQPSKLWNFLLDRVRGRYVSCLDDDNTKLPEFVARMSAELEANPALDVVTCGWFVTDSDGVVCSEDHLNLQTSFEGNRQRSTCDGGSTLIRRSAFDRVGYFAEDIRTNEDWDWRR